MGIKKKAKTSHENTAADPGPAAATSRREMQGVEATDPVSASAPLENPGKDLAQAGGGLVQGTPILRRHRHRRMAG